MKIGSAELRWLGHAGFLLTHNDKVIYIDPYDIGRARPDADYILITHDHYDHLSIEDIDSVATEHTITIAPDDCREKLQDLPGTFRSVEAGKEYDFPDFSLNVIPAYNTDKKFHPQTNAWVGYIMDMDGKTLYHSGDTDIIPEMRGLNVDVALLPVSGTYVMDAQQAAKAVKSINCKRAVPMHWGSFIGTREDAETFKKAAPCPVFILDKE